MAAGLARRLENLRAWRTLRCEAGWPTIHLDARIAALEARSPVLQGERAERTFLRRFPALAKWAREILAAPASNPPLAVAAAYEVIQAECEEVGQWSLAEDSAALAHHALGGSLQDVLSR